MRRLNTTKQSRHLAQLSEYQSQSIHKVIVTANSDSANLMQVKSNVSDKVYSLHLEFTEDATGIGEEIRDTLKERYLQKMKSGSMQSAPSALQSTTQDKGEMEDNA